MAHLYCFDPLLVSLNSALAITRNTIVSLQLEIAGINELLQQKMKEMTEAQNNFFLLQDKLKTCDEQTQSNWKMFIGRYKSDPSDGCLFETLPDNVIEKIAMYAGMDHYDSHRVCKRWHKAFNNSYRDIFQNWIERTHWDHVRLNLPCNYDAIQRDPRELYHLMKKAESNNRRWEKSEAVIVKNPHYYPLNVCYDEGRLLTMGRCDTTKAELKLWDAENGNMFCQYSLLENTLSYEIGIHLYKNLFFAGGSSVFVIGSITPDGCAFEENVYLEEDAREPMYDGERLVVISNDKIKIFKDLEDMEHFTMLDTNYVRHFDLQESELLCSGLLGCTLWDLRSCCTVVDFPELMTSNRVARVDKVIYVDMHNTIRVVDLRTGQTMHTLKFTGFDMMAAGNTIFSHNQKWLYSWDINTSNEFFTEFLDYRRIYDTCIGSGKLFMMTSQSEQAESRISAINFT